MNATQYYIIDSFIKKQGNPEIEVGLVHGEGEDERDEGLGPFEERASSSDIDIDDDDNAAVEDEGKKALLSPKVKENRRTTKIKTHEYDPELDGENSPMGSGSSSGAGRFINRESERGEDAVDGK